MIKNTEFVYKPREEESEKASNSYLMSLIALIAGLPIPLVNLIATLVFWASNRKGSYYVRWHCTQALLSQFSLLIMNSVAVWWTLILIFGSGNPNNLYIAYVFTVLLYNLTEFIATIYSAVRTRKGEHIQWFFYGNLTDRICKPNL